MARNIKGFQISGLVGNVDFKSFKDDKSVLNFSVAVSESKKVNDGWVQLTDWFNCQLWNPTEYDKTNIVKGTKVFVSGTMKSTVKEKVTYWNFRADSVDYVFSSNSAQPQKTSNDEQYDDVPF